MTQCTVKKMGEFNMLRCACSEGHEGEHCYYSVPNQVDAPKRTAERFIVRTKEGKFAYMDEITPDMKEVHWTYSRATMFTMEEAGRIVRQKLGAVALNVAI